VRRLGSVALLIAAAAFTRLPFRMWRSRVSQRNSRLVDRRRGYPGAARDPDAAAAFILTCRAIEKNDA